MFQAFVQIGVIAKMRWPIGFASHESRVTNHELRKAGGRACRTIGLDGGRRMRSLPLLCRQTLREKASASCFSLRAIQATAEESRLPGQARSRASRHSSIARRARNVPPDVSRSRRRHFHQGDYVDRNRDEIGITCRPPAIRKMPHSSGSRILGEDLGSWRSSLS